MPELPEVETTMRAMQARLLGQRLVDVEQRRKDLRFPLPEKLPQRLKQRKVEAFGRRAKYILVHLDDGYSLLLHLGMSGRLVFDGSETAPHEHLTFHFANGAKLSFIDPRRFGMIDLAHTDHLIEHRWLAHLGLEPLDDHFSGSALKARLAGRVQPIKTAIMDQRLVVGVGNIYASESLHRSGISPRTKAGTLSLPRCKKLVRSIKDTLSDAIDAGGSSLRDYVNADGKLGNFQSAFRVYGRDGLACPVCESLVVKIVQGQRATFYCAKCQHK